MQERFSLYDFVSCSPSNFVEPFSLKGQKYKTVDAAASEVIKEINPTSKSQDTEYAGYITKDANGEYSSTPANKGSEAGANPGKKPANAVADWHTHGGANPKYKSEDFSKKDKADNDKTGLPGYLGTPMDKVLRYDPKNSGGSGGTTTPVAEPETSPPPTKKRDENGGCN